MSNIPDNIIKKAAEISKNLLPEKSRERYEEEYSKFTDWCKVQSVELRKVSDEVLLVYLSEKSKIMKSSTLWSRFSMIKSCLKLKENVDISNFDKTLAFLKRQSVGYQPTKAKVFTADEI